ncbi:MgtC/SapB family protein [Streptomyces sp. NBC_00162]|uniref:MgtC/SapB family protein n=1 Tax=Streptomyces sp. NBC_00162 TaxID=2903629 RepID=UPI00214C30B9|nr:MgtC/SapB family protein [Streptomyces sp. NBC_00162]UUU39431.1 MgtC/SapB family protein [Streptomyces sp. NBC_00162]
MQLTEWEMAAHSPRLRPGDPQPAALGLGAVIGLERQWRARLAGLRTNALVAGGAALFVPWGAWRAWACSGWAPGAPWAWWGPTSCCARWAGGWGASAT